MCQYWDDPSVIGQAIILYDTLAGKRRTDYARRVLWLCGYDVNPDLVRKYWLALLSKQQLHRRAETNEFPSDKYTAEIELVARSLSKLEYFNVQTADLVARESANG